MDDSELGTMGRPASIMVEKVGRRLIDVGLGRDDSLVTPGTPIWTTSHLDELIADYVDTPDSGGGGFFETLRVRLATTSPGAIQLFAELLILQALPLINFGGKNKEKQINEVLDMSPDRVELPDDVRATILAGGVFNGGPAFTVNREAQITYLIRVALRIKAMPDDLRASALSDPLAFRDAVDGIPTSQAAQRQSLLYLAFPQFYLPIVTLAEREAIRDALAPDYLGGPAGDLDSDLAAIYQAITDAEGRYVDLYKTPWVERWKTPPKPPLPRPARLQLADATDGLAAQTNVDVGWLQDCIELLRERRQVVFYGPPGTGKTFIARALARHVADEENVKLVQFHPAYSYEDFFEGFRPIAVPGGADGQIGFSLKAGPLRLLADKASNEPGSAHVLIIDEMNRGNLPKIFGELYFLLEYRDAAIDLMYSPGGSFSLPKNVFVIGTMNTADRSIALVDAALRRRFAFRALHPSESPTSGILRKWLDSKGYLDGVAVLQEKLNERIADDDFKIGPSYFMRDTIAADPEGKAIELMWGTDILPLLEEHHFGDDIDVEARYGLDTLRKAVAASSVVGADKVDPAEGDHDASAADSD